jgi:hypothetical protein
LGYRLHFAKHFEVNWQGGFFSSDSVLPFEQLYYDKFYENGWKEEYADVFEVDRTDLTAYVKHLSTLKPKGKNKYFKEDTNEQIIGVFEEVLTSDDDVIRLEWF